MGGFFSLLLLCFFLVLFFYLGLWALQPVWEASRSCLWYSPRSCQHSLDQHNSVLTLLFRSLQRLQPPNVLRLDASYFIFYFCFRCFMDVHRFSLFNHILPSKQSSLTRVHFEWAPLQRRVLYVFLKYLLPPPKKKKTPAAVTVSSLHATVPPSETSSDTFVLFWRCCFFLLLILCASFHRFLVGDCWMSCSGLWAFWEALLSQALWWWLW